MARLIVQDWWFLSLACAVWKKLFFEGKKISSRIEKMSMGLAVWVLVTRWTFSVYSTLGVRYQHKKNTIYTRDICIQFLFFCENSDSIDTEAIREGMFGRRLMWTVQKGSLQESLIVSVRLFVQQTAAQQTHSGQAEPFVKIRIRESD